MWTIAILVCLAAVSLGDVPSCPPNEDIYPCLCRKPGQTRNIICKGIIGLTPLEPVLKYTHGQKFSFKFINFNFGDVPSDLFEGQKIHSIYFSNCTIGSFGEKPFTGLEDSLEVINIEGSMDKTRKPLESFRVSHLSKLEHLYLQSKHIVRLGNDWFESGPESLTKLNLRANDIEEIGDRAFASLVNVEKMWLRDNRIKTIARSMFPRPANELTFLEMSNNEIETLPTGMFEDFPVLDVVDFSRNKLKSIPESVWGSIWPQLNFAHFEWNAELVCTEEMKWIYEQRLLNYFGGTCGYGNDLYDRDLAHLKLEDFQ